MSTESFVLVREVVAREAAIVLGEGKRYLVEARLKPLIGTLGCESIDGLCVRLREGDRRVADLVVDALTTNETSFFRDGHPFETLRAQLLPSMIERRASVRRLRIWCGASSSGQEPVTLALVIREHFPELADWDVRILATDISEEMLARCRTGVYNDLEVSRGLPAHLLQRHFARVEGGWSTNPAIRSLLRFEKRNLAAPLDGFPQQDLVIMRNVLIYFSNETKAKILSEVQRILAPDGALLLGTAESATGLVDGFATEFADRTTYYRLAPRRAA